VDTSRTPLPSVWRIALSRGQVELKAFFRERQSVVFILAMPAVMLVLLGAIFGQQHTAPGITVGDIYVAGLIGGGVMATSYQNLGMSIAFERERFTLKRLRGTPMPAAAYFVGKIIQVIVAAIAEVAVLLAIGVAFYHLRLPTSGTAWWTFTWVFVLGVAACSLLGIAASSLPRSAGMDASFGLSGTLRPLPMATEVVLLRVCQEALANVRKHACAYKATVELRYDPEAVLLEVIDDGAGFDPARVSGGFGLRGMRTRVAEAGGTLTVSSSPGVGTQVSAMVPA
jgi:hypothetical protein